MGRDVDIYFVDFGNMKCKGMENKRWLPDIQVRVFNADSSLAHGTVDCKENIVSSSQKNIHSIAMHQR